MREHIGIILSLISLAGAGYGYVEWRIGEAVEQASFVLKVNLEAHARIMNEANEIINSLCDREDHMPDCQRKFKTIR